MEITIPLSTFLFLVFIGGPFVVAVCLSVIYNTLTKRKEV